MLQTVLYDEHKKLNARFTEFGGWEMPVFYSSIIDEHNAVRNKAGIFDTSHMGEILISGPGAVNFLEKLVPARVAALAPGQARYSMLLNENGGIIDDIIIYRREKDILLIVNASNAGKDFEWLKKNITQSVSLENLSAGLCLLALQGPEAEKLLQPFVKQDLSKIKYFNFITPDFVPFKPEFAFLARTGYTGEDGFELLFSKECAVQVWQALLKAGAKPCGLGCRDTLRLGACMPLHGHEIDEATTPLEAGLSWAVSFDKDFIGKPALVKEKNEGLKKYLAAFSMSGGIPRGNCDIIYRGEKTGSVVSGTFSPTLKKGIGMGFSAKRLEPGEKIEILIHGQKKPAEVVKKPFYKRIKN